MYPKFIELHNMHNEAFSVNVNEIVMFKNGRLWVTSDRGDECVPVAEAYYELKALIKDCGCLIHKEDPRLDTEHPLTMDDLMTMVGEPVWNSNTRDWWLIHYYMEYPEFDVIIVYNKDGVQESWYREDLIKTPLYRMKSGEK